MNISTSTSTTASTSDSYAQLHKGHDAQHQMILIIFLLTIIVSQALIILWKKYYFYSYSLFSLGALWIFPFLFCIYTGISNSLRFLLIWSLYSSYMAYLIHLARRPNKNTPRFVYKSFRIIYFICYTAGIVGYFIIILQLFFASSHQTSLGSILFFYSLYFGVLGRDLVVVLSASMASSIGYYAGEGGGITRRFLRNDTCAICNDDTETTHRLNCGHAYHDDCLRGWCVLGKKDVCAYCKEKVDMERFKRHQWDSNEVLYLQLLDGVRYFVVYQPIIFGISQLVITMSGLE